MAEPIRINYLPIRFPGFLLFCCILIFGELANTAFAQQAGQQSQQSNGGQNQGGEEQSSSGAPSIGPAGKVTDIVDDVIETPDQGGDEKDNSGAPIATQEVIGLPTPFPSSAPGSNLGATSATSSGEPAISAEGIELQKRIDKLVRQLKIDIEYLPSALGVGNSPFYDPWLVPEDEQYDFPNLDEVKLPQDEEVDVTLEEYRLLIETRQSLMDRSQLRQRNETALAFFEGFDTYLGYITDRLSRLKAAHEKQSGEVEGRGELDALEAQRRYFEEVQIFLRNYSRRLTEQRETWRDQEELLFARRNILQRITKQKTKGPLKLVRSEANTVELGELESTLAEARELDRRLAISRDLLFSLRHEAAIIALRSQRARSEQKRIWSNLEIKSENGETTGTSALGPQMEIWLVRYKAFLGDPDCKEASKEKKGEINKTEITNGENEEDAEESKVPEPPLCGYLLPHEQTDEQRVKDQIKEANQSISGLVSDLDGIVSEVEAQIEFVEGDPEALLTFFKEEEKRIKERARKVSLELESFSKTLEQYQAEEARIEEEIEGLNKKLGDQKGAQNRWHGRNIYIPWRTEARLQLDEAKNRLSYAGTNISTAERGVADLEGALKELRRRHEFWTERAVSTKKRLEEQRWDKTKSVGIFLIGVTLSSILLMMAIHYGGWALLSVSDKQLDKYRGTGLGSRAKTIFKVVKGVLHLVIVTIAVILVLYKLGTGERIISYLIGSVGIVALAVSFGAQNVLSDLIAGFFIVAENHFVEGDWIQIDQSSGVVEKVGLRSTAIRDLDGQRHVFTNGDIKHVINKTMRFARAKMDIGVSYADHPEDVLKALENFCSSLSDDEFFKDRLKPDIAEPQVYGIERFDESSIIYRLVLTTAPGNQWEVARHVRRLLYQLFEEEGFTIPFPQRTLHLGPELRHAIEDGDIWNFDGLAADDSNASNSRTQDFEEGDEPEDENKESAEDEEGPDKKAAKPERGEKSRKSVTKVFDGAIPSDRAYKESEGDDGEEGQDDKQDAKTQAKGGDLSSREKKDAPSSPEDEMADKVKEEAEKEKSGEEREEEKESAKNDKTKGDG